MSDTLTQLQLRFDELKSERQQIGEIIKQAFMAAPPMPQPGAMQDPAMMQGGAPPPGMPMDPAMMQGGMPPGMDPAMMGGAPPMDPAMMQGGAPPPGMDPAAGGAPPMDPQIVDQLVGALEDLSNQFMSFAQQQQQQTEQVGQALEQLQQELAQQEDTISGLERQVMQLTAEAQAQPRQPLAFG